MRDIDTRYGKATLEVTKDEITLEVDDGVAILAIYRHSEDARVYTKNTGDDYSSHYRAGDEEGGLLGALLALKKHMDKQHSRGDVT